MKERRKIKKLRGQGRSKMRSWGIERRGGRGKKRWSKGKE